MANGKVEYHSGKVFSIARMIAGLVKNNPLLAEDFDLLKATLIFNIPELGDKTICPNCTASMKEYIYTFDAWDALLLVKMAGRVKEGMLRGLEFTEANQVRVPDLDTSHAVKCRTTQAAKLGLIAEFRMKGSGRRLPGVWSITRRGWDALKGKPVPKRVKVWRKHIEERFEETTTIAEAFRNHAVFMARKRSRGQAVTSDNSADMNAYSAETWLSFDIHEGNLF